MTIHDVFNPDGDLTKHLVCFGCGSENLTTRDYECEECKGLVAEAFQQKNDTEIKWRSVSFTGASSEDELNLKRDAARNFDEYSHFLIVAKNHNVCIIKKSHDKYQCSCKLARSKLARYKDVKPAEFYIGFDTLFSTLF